MSSGISSRDGAFRTVPSRLGWLAQSRLFPLFVAALSVFLALPALGAGWLLDDYYHRTVMLPGAPYGELLGGPAEMFRFFRGDPVRTRRVMDVGIFPWWTDPTLKAEMLQALTVLTHELSKSSLPGAISTGCSTRFSAPTAGRWHWAKRCS